MARTGQAATGPERARPRPVREPAAPPRWDDAALRARIDAVLNRHPAVGLAVGIVRDGSLQLFDGRGFADIASGVPIGEDTVFRIGSVTKVVTAITVMQLREEGLVDLDAPPMNTCARTNLSRRAPVSGSPPCATCSPTPPGSRRRATSAICST
jgi:CubicO group peptidase (beta-lactamase class C family)